MVERYHRTLNAYMRAFTQKNPDSWHTLLNYATFSYNNTVNSSTGYSPNELAFGHTIQLPTSLNNKPVIYNYDNYKDELRNNLYEARKHAKEQMLKRKQSNKKYYDKSTNELDLQFNDLVLIRCEVKKSKYANVYDGPYRVEKVINDVSVKIRRGNKSEIIHKNRLVKANADYGKDTPPELVEIYSEDDDDTG